MSPESITSGYNQPPDGDWVVNGNLNVEGTLSVNGSPVSGGGLNDGVTVIAAAGGHLASNANSVSWGDTSAFDLPFDPPNAIDHLGVNTSLPTWVSFDSGTQTFAIVEAGMYFLEGEVALDSPTPGSAALAVVIGLGGDQAGLPAISGPLAARSNHWGFSRLAIVAAGNTPSPLGLSIQISGVNFGAATLTPVFSVTKLA